MSRFLAERSRIVRATVRRIDADRERLPAELVPLLDVTRRRLFDRDLTAAKLWEQSGVSRAEAPAFAALLGDTPWKYLSALRLDMAKEILATTSFPVGHLSRFLAYHSHAAFAMAFRRKTGLQPSAYRAEQEPDPRICTARLAVLVHEGARACLDAGDVDRAHEELRFAETLYGRAGELPADLAARRDRIPLSSETAGVLLSELCSGCRERLTSGADPGLKRHLRRCLLPIPRQQPWFEAACDECYRTVWAAISCARAGAMDDAWQAWWLASHADPEDREAPPSLARYLAAVTRVEQMVGGDQLVRKGYSDLAVQDAIALDDPSLEAQGRLLRAVVLTALARFPEARADLDAASAVRETPWGLAWGRALQSRVAGVLESRTGNFQQALLPLRDSAEIYRSVDPHWAGLILVEMAINHADLGDFEAAIGLDQQALSILDGRRDPRSTEFAVQLHIAYCLASLKRLTAAEEALSRCKLDEEIPKGWAASAFFTRACIKLLRHESQRSVELFKDAVDLFEELHRPIESAVCVAYMTEAHARSHNPKQALVSAKAAIRLFEAVGCSQDSLEALGRLRSLLDNGSQDLASVVRIVRGVARSNGGWLPEE